MLRYLFTRFIRTVLVLGGLSLVVFLLLALSGDPVEIMAPAQASAEDLERIRDALGVEDPLPERYLGFVQRAITGDFGVSWRYQQPALQLVLSRLPATAELAVAALAIMLVVGGPLGVISAVRRGSAADVASVNFSLILRALPSFWLGLMLILLLSIYLGWLPTSGRGTPLHLVMPATTLAAAGIAEILLLTRSGMLDVLDEDYIRTAQSKGLRKRLVYLRHALPNAALPVASVAGLLFARLLGGSVVTEIVFAWPGVGSMAVDAVLARDFPVVQASVMVIALVVTLASLITDAAYSVLDPRIRQQ